MNRKVIVEFRAVYGVLITHTNSEDNLNLKDFKFSKEFCPFEEIWKMYVLDFSLSPEKHRCQRPGPAKSGRL